MQSEQLTQGDVTPFSYDVDFGKLAKHVTDDSGVPKTGPMNRILASHYSFGQGIDPTKICFEIGGVDLGAKCIGRNLGQLQSYSLYVPKKPMPAKTTPPKTAPPKKVPPKKAPAKKALEPSPTTPTDQRQEGGEPPPTTPMV